MSKIIKYVIITTVLFVASIWIVYSVSEHFFYNYFDKWGDKLVSLEKRNLLSQNYGAGWKDVIADESMAEKAGLLVKDSIVDNKNKIDIIDGVRLSDYPSLAIIRKLNAIQKYSNKIEITDRLGRQIAEIRTNHTRFEINDFPKTLITALLSAEDGNFFTNDAGFEFNSYVRAVIRAVLSSIKNHKIISPKGTSTITQQVAKLFISNVDENGQRIVGHSVNRKIREMKISSALRKLYTPDEILEVYLNHCVTSDYGLIGFGDIASGLFKKDLKDLSDAECVYLARMVKWGRNLNEKIIKQCKIDMPRMGVALNWTKQKQESVLDSLRFLKFYTPDFIKTDYGPLVDCANEFWMKIVEKTGHGITKENMDLINSNSLIRKKGNLSIQLTIDLPLQNELERLVNARGYGNDTIIRTDVRIGSYGEDIISFNRPSDTLRLISILNKKRRFNEPNSNYSTVLNIADTLITNIRYKKTGKNKYRRSCFYYTRKPMKVNGQYFSYCILDSKTGKILAYYSRDRIGSRMVSLLRNRTPNGSSTAKPIFYALNFDLGTFKPYDKWTDSIPVTDDVPWKRSIIYDKTGKGIGCYFANSAVRGRGYKVSNHGHNLEGCKYVYEHLTGSNNILGVELVYRLNTQLFDSDWRIRSDAFKMNRFFYRLGIFDRIKNELKLKSVTGVRVYKEIARIVGVDVDTMFAYGRNMPISDSMYSVGLGTLELTLYEQAHIFNSLYNNELIENPKAHPSLVIKNIVLNGEIINITKLDTVKRYHLFSDINNIRPVLLGLHNRLVENKYDNLQSYDVEYHENTENSDSSKFDSNAYTIVKPLSNFAKSGTTDDVLRPFNVDITSKKRTNYGLWNAVVRIDMSKLDKNISEPEIKDLTIACIGECNYEHTGARDGKSLHKFLSLGLLKKAGIKCNNGFYSQYERYIRRVTPDSINCSNVTP